MSISQLVRCLSKRWRSVEQDRVEYAKPLSGTATYRITLLSQLPVFQGPKEDLNEQAKKYTLFGSLVPLEIS